MGTLGKTSWILLEVRWGVGSGRLGPGFWMGGPGECLTLHGAGGQDSVNSAWVGFFSRGKIAIHPADKKPKVVDSVFIDCMVSAGRGRCTGLGAVKFIATSSPVDAGPRAKV